MGLFLDGLEKEYSNKWVIQNPFIDEVIALEQLEKHIEVNKDKILSIFSNTDILCIQLHKNTFVLNNIGYGGICSKCNSDLIAIYFKDAVYLDKNLDLDNTIWLPSFESNMIKSVNINSFVCPINLYDLNDKNILYKSLCCEDKWKYLKYEKPFGLTYSKELAECISNKDNVEKIEVKLMTSDILKEKYPKGSTILIGDTRENVENLNMNYIYSWVNSFMDYDKSNMYFTTFTITGYDADKRELWEIPEVKKYITKLLDEKPQILYYLDLKLWSILCYSSTLSTTNSNGQVKIAIDKNKVIELSKKSLRAIKNIDYLTKNDINKYMNDFNKEMKTDIY